MDSKIKISERDTKFYKLFTLENGLKVLLITESQPRNNPSETGENKGKQRKFGRRSNKSPSRSSGTFYANFSRNIQVNLTSKQPSPKTVFDGMEMVKTYGDCFCKGQNNKSKFSWRKSNNRQKKAVQTNDRKIEKERKEYEGGDDVIDDGEPSLMKQLWTFVSIVHFIFLPTIQSAVSLTVGVGSMSEPQSIPGLAHYLEHMVFMGSEKYPVSNDFDLFLKAHGGSTNARTDYEKTHFYFDIHSVRLCDALDRFAQFFISPLMSKECMTSEAKVVHSEWAMNLQKERARFEQLLLSMTKQGHPIRKFMWGNYDTLVKNPSQENVDVYKALHNFRKKYYVAQNMSLVIFSDYDPVVVENCVRLIFLNIPNSNDKREDFGHLGDPYDTPEFRRLYKIVPVHTSHQLEITWSLPSLIKDYRRKPLQYLERVIGDYGVGSIFSALLKREWVRYMNCGNNDSSQDMNSSSSLFRIIFYLTDEGFNNVKSIITLVLQYLRMLREVGPQEYLWKELHQVDMNEFTYDEQVDLQDYSNLICNSMLDVADEDIIISNFVIMEYDPNLIMKCLDLLSPKRMNLVLRSQEFKGKCTLEEKWFRSMYSVEDIPENWMKEWIDPPSLQSRELHLPPANQFIATDFTLKPFESRYRNIKGPIKCYDVGRIWFKSNYDFQQPKAYYFFYFWCQSMNRTATESCLSDIFVLYFMQRIKEVTCPADLAHLIHGVNIFENGFYLRFSGFDNKLRSLVSLYLDEMSNLSILDAENAPKFNSIKRLLIDRYKNMTLCPEDLNMQLHHSHLLSHSWPINQKLDSMECITRDMLHSYMCKLFDGVYCEALFQGNVSSTEAIKMCDEIINKLKLRPIVECSNIYITEILPGSTVIACPNRNQMDNNCVITNYYQVGHVSGEERLLNEMLVMLMEEPCFEELRTKKQLGYSVSTSVAFMFGVVGFTITICSQSNKFTMEELDDHIEGFLSSFYKKVLDMTDDDFESAKFLMTSTREGGDGSLGGQVMRNWEEIINHEYLFERHAVELRQLEKLNLNDLKAFCVRMIPPDKYLQRKLTVQVIGNM